MKRLFSIVAAALLLTACGSGGDSDVSDPLVTSSAVTATPTLTKAAPKPGKIGEPVTIKCAGMVDCSTSFTITSVVKNTECELGEKDYGDDYAAKAKVELKPGDSYLHIKAILDAPANAQSWAMLDDPTITDKDGFSKTAETSMRCQDYNEEYSIWSSTVDPGQKKRLYTVLRIPEGATDFSVEGTKFTLAEVLGAESPSSTPKVGKEAQPVTSQAVAQDEPYVVECLDGVPGPALWSDGSMRHSDMCWETRGGAEYAAAESAAGLVDPATIPIAEGGTCPAYLCGYGTDANGNQKPTSGEIQGYHGCQEGYITDPAYCAAVTAKMNQ